MDLDLLRLNTLFPEASCYVFNAIRYQIYRMFDTDGMVFTSNLIFTYTKKYIHSTQGPID